MKNKTLVSGAIFGFLTVAIGAFGAHGLKELLVENGRIDTFETGVQYQSIHALALLFLGVYRKYNQAKILSWAAVCFVTGVLIFSGSLYVLSISNAGFWGAITPIGGLLMLAGWVSVIVGIVKEQKL